MAKAKEKQELVKENWIASFNLTGDVKVNDNTFQLDQQSKKSDWNYSRANIGFNCGDDYGTVYAQMMGGYGVNRENLIYVHGKDDDGKDDFTNRYTINFDDRNDENILKDIGDRCFYTAALELDTKGKLVYKKFLSQYDMVQYLSEHLTDGMTVNVGGNLTYQLYEGNVSVQKEINRITLINDPNPDNYRAEFTQTILIDKDSKGEVDKDKMTLGINGYVLEYFKEYNGYDLSNGDKKGAFVPLLKSFEYKLPDDPEKAKKAVTKLFKPKKGVTQITFHGNFAEGGAVVQMTLDDLPDDIKEMIDCGIYTEEEALAECATNGSRERRMILTRPLIKKVTNNDGTITQIPQFFPGQYNDEDLELDCLVKKEDDGDGFMNIPEDVEEEMDWLDSI